MAIIGSRPTKESTKRKLRKLSSKETHAAIRRRPKSNRLRELRERGVILSQAQVAQYLGVDSPTVCRHESGVRALTRDMIIAYSKLYGVSTYEIFVRPDELEKDPPAPELAP